MFKVLEILGVKPQLLKGNLSLGLPNVGYIIGVLGIGRLSKSKNYIENTVKLRDEVCHYFLSEQIGNEYKAYVVAAKLYNQISKPTQKGEICILLMTRWGFDPNGNTQLDTSATEKAFGFLFGWLLGSLKHHGPFIMKTLVKDGPPTFSETEEFLVMQVHDDSHRLLLKLFFYKMKWQQLLFGVQKFLKVHSTISLVKLATYKEVNLEGKVISNISHFDFSIDDDKKEVVKFMMSKWNIGTTGKAYLRRFASMFVTLKKGIIFDPGGILFLTTTGKCKNTLKCPLEDNEIINKWGDEVINEFDSNDTIKELGATCTRGNLVDVSLGTNGSKLKYNIEMLVLLKIIRLVKHQMKMYMQHLHYHWCCLEIFKESSWCCTILWSRSCVGLDIRAWNCKSLPATVQGLMEKW